MVRGSRSTPRATAVTRLLQTVLAAGLLLLTAVGGTATAAPPPQPAYCTAPHIGSFAPDPSGIPSKFFEDNLTTEPGTGGAIGIPTNSSTTGSVSNPSTGNSFMAGWTEETELYQYLNNGTGGPTPNGSPGADDTARGITMPAGTVVPDASITASGPSLPTTGAGLPYGAVFNVNANGTLGSLIKGQLPVTISGQNYVPNTQAWQHDTIAKDPTYGQPKNTTCGGGDNLHADMTFSASSVAGLHAGTVYAAYLLVRDTDESGPVSSHVWYFTPPAAAAPTIYLGYADSYPVRQPLPTFPSPWQGSQSALDPSQPVQFVGCGLGPEACPTVPTTGADWYDDGTIRIDNPPNGQPLTFTGTGSNIQIGVCTYTPWTGITVTDNPGQTMILAQTGGDELCGDQIKAATGQDPGTIDADDGENLDTSESYAQSQNYLNYIHGGAQVCSNDGLIPVVTLQINGQPTTITDNGQILNDHGVDQGGSICGVSFTADLAQGSNVLTNVHTTLGGTTGLAPNAAVTGYGFPNGFTIGEAITAVNSAADTITVSVPANVTQPGSAEQELFSEAEPWSMQGVTVTGGLAAARDSARSTKAKTKHHKRHHAHTHKKHRKHHSRHARKRGRSVVRHPARYGLS